MPLDRNYTNLTVNRSECEALRTDFDKQEIPQSFNTWVIDVSKSSLSRHKFLKKHLADYSFADLDGQGFAIFDKKTDTIVRIHTDGKHLICSEHKKNLCDHKIFAGLHPKFFS